MNDRIYNQLDRLEAKLSDIEERLNDYNADLKFHIARTNQIEDALLQLHTDFKPVESHVEQVRGATKLIGWILAIATTIGGLTWWKK